MLLAVAALYRQFPTPRFGIGLPDEQRWVSDIDAALAGADHAAPARRERIAKDFDSRLRARLVS